MRDKERVMRMHMCNGMQVCVTICYRDYRSNDRCTKYRDVIILLLPAALRYFRFGICVVCVTEQSINSYREYPRIFWSVSVNLITLLNAKRRPRSTDCEAERHRGSRCGKMPFTNFPMISARTSRVAIWLPHRFVKFVGACKIWATLLRLTFIELSVPFHRQTSGISMMPR